MTADPKVSPRPWRVDPDHRADIQAHDGKDIGTAFHQGVVGMTLRLSGPMSAQDDDEGAANAAHIVRCVNAHDGLVEALELVLHSFDDGPPSMQAVRLDDACKNAQAVLAALAAAKEGA